MIYVACMTWPGYITPVCASKNKKRAIKEAVRILREWHGDGPVMRREAMISAPITARDISIIEVPVV